MTITRPSHSTFVIQTKNSEEITLVLDPVIEKNKIVVPRGKADVYLSTVVGMFSKELASVGEQQALRVHSAGEYELKGIFIFGVPCEFPGATDQGPVEGSQSVLYVIESEGIHLCALGSLRQAKLTTEQLEKIGSIDVLLVSLGVGSVSPAELVEIVEQLEPRVILLGGPGKPSSDGVVQFSKKTGLKPELLDKVKLMKKDLPQEETRLIILEET